MPELLFKFLLMQLTKSLCFKKRGETETSSSYSWTILILEVFFEFYVPTFIWRKTVYFHPKQYSWGTLDVKFVTACSVLL
jgi:hypothetical protein